jgi:HD-GYP domain-containing protein (c-di-GMP phosphodiesterase class II)
VDSPARRDPAQPSRAEVLAALSLALDLGLGQPMEHMLRSAVLGAGLAERMGLSRDQRAVVYYAGLMSWVGCNADSPEVSAVLGDDIAYRRATYGIDLRGMPLMWLLLRHVSAEGGPLVRELNRASFALSARQRMTTMLQSHHASAGVLADRLGLGERVRDAIGYTFERWDGEGLPQGAAGVAIPIEMRVVHVADVAEVHLRQGGVAEALAVVRRRSGTQFDPDVARVFEQHADELAASLPADDAWAAALALAPDREHGQSPEELDDLLAALGDFVDLKSTYRQGHSRAVAALVERAARLRGLPESEVRLVRRAAWVHDLGRMGVPTTIWDKRGPRSPSEQERVRLYPYLTQRILQRVPGLGDVAVLASLHRERLDGSGYPHGVGGAVLGPAARLLAAADVHQSLVEPRRDRAALAPGEVVAVVRGEVDAGRLDQQAVEAVLEAAGQPAPRARQAHPAGLTDRELEVLRLVAVGRSSREVAAELTISEKTVRNHLEHIYAKAAVRNRVGASMFAMQHGVLPAVLPQR